MKKARISPRKEPKQGRSRGLVDSIVTAAARVLVRQGYEYATTNRVAEAAGVSIGSLYQYFPNKDSLVAAVIDGAIEAHRQRIERAIEKVKDEPLEDVLRLVVEAAFDLYSGNSALFKVIFVQAPQLDRVQNVLRARKHIAQLLGVVLESKGVRPKHRDLTLYVLMNGALGVMQTAMFELPTGYTMADVKSELVELLMAYVRELPRDR